MEIKVRALDDVESKSVQEVEAQLLEKHEESLNETPAEPVAEAVEEPVVEQELKEEDVLSYIGKRYGRDISSLDELNQEREQSEDLPDDVAAYFKYKKETGRGIEDFVKLNRDIDKVDPNVMLKEYLMATEEGLDEEDIESVMQEYDYDEELDDEAFIKKTKVAKKKIIAKAKKHFNEQKEAYKVPLESSGSPSLEDSEEYQSYKQYVEQSKTFQEEQTRKAEWFGQKSDEVFGSEFKGFEFAIDDKSYVFSPGDKAELRKLQDTPQAWINKFVDDKGLVNDAVGYHKSLAVAMNPEKFAKFFYEQGKSEAVDDVMRKTKNINMSERSTPQAVSKGEFSVKAVSPDSGRGLKVRSVKRTS